jgi:hypothetical protein
MKEFVQKYEAVRKENHPYRMWLRSSQDHILPDQDHLGFLMKNATTDTAIWDREGSDTHKAWLGICALWKHPWWARTWIFQETTIPERQLEVWWAGMKMMHAESKVKFLCGRETASWNDITVTNSICSHLQALPALKSATGFLENLHQPVTNLIRFRAMRLKRQSPSLLDFLNAFRGTQCFDPRDKVYAPLCLAPESAALAIMPDCQAESVRDVYIDVVKYSLAQSGNELDFLGHTMFTGDGPPESRYNPSIREFVRFFTKTNQTQLAIGPEGLEFPSWLPDWSKLLTLTPIPKTLYVPTQPESTLQATYDLFRGVAHKNETQIPSFEATKGASCTARIDGIKLHLQAIYVDKIDDIIPLTGNDMEVVKQAGYEKGVKWGRESDGGNYGATGEGFIEALDRTLALDLKYDWRGRACARGGFRDDELLQRPKEGMSREDLELRSQAMAAAYTAERGRCLGRTRQGFMGMVPNRAQVGDIVFAILGGKVLYTLRLESELECEYTYIGETYIHGLMDGLMMECVNDFAKVVDIVIV